MARILLVDDEPMLRSALRQYLEFSGHEVEEAGDGNDALELLRNGVPDIVISDVLMPARDGMSLCRALRADAALANVPFLFMTARGTQPELYQEMVQIGDGCIVKPFEPSDLLAEIARAIVERRPA